MAGNRLHLSGSIFSRLTGIIRAGAMKEQDIPIWHDVYKTFPPKYEPAYARPAVEKEIMPIFYPEDLIRGKFIDVYGSAGMHCLLKPGRKSIMQMFVEKYQELEKSSQYSTEEEIFSATESALRNEGVEFIRTRRIPASTSKSTDSEANNS